MSVILFVLGMVLTGLGVIGIGFGLWLNGLAIGQTLISAGAIGFAGGLILVGLAAAVGELNKIAEGMRPRAPGRAARAAARSEAGATDLLVERVPRPKAVEVRPAEIRAVEPRPPEPRPPELRPPDPRPPEPRPPEPRVAAEPRPVEPRPPEPRPPEPRAVEVRTAADSQLEVSASAIERLRSSLPRNERPKNDIVANIENGPLSSPNGAANGANGAHPPHPPVEPHPVPAPIAKGANGAGQHEAAVGEAGKAPRLDFLFRSKGARPGQPESFDALWPKRPGKGGAPQPRQPGAERPAPSERPPAAEQPAPPMAAAPAPRAEAPRSVGILKSGVVDGMAYTLYADGSIEAQLPQGTVRFGSIAELRAHIENNP
jgi:hypothetical protein